MRKCIRLIAAVGFMMSFLLFANHQEARAQVRPTQDAILFMSSVEGGVTKSPRTFDPNGQWCVSQGWHESYPPGPPSDPYPAGPLDAVDEVSQWGTPGWDQNWVNSYGNCENAYGDPVELATLGITYSGAACAPSTPCPSLFVRVRSFVYTRSCNVIEADLYNYATYNTYTQTGDWKGKLRILHASGSNGVAVISVAYNTFYSAHVSLGTMVGEDPLSDCNITGPHAHQDFMPPTQSNNCTLSWNGAILTSDPNRTVNPDGKSSDWQRWGGTNSYVHALYHFPGDACVVPGPEAADWLLRPGAGELDDTGAGTMALAQTGTPIQAYTCFTQSQWCGYLIVDKKLLRALYGYYLTTQEPIPTVEGQVIYAYPILGGVMRVQWVAIWGPGVTGQYISSCLVKLVPGEPMYDVSVPVNTDPCPPPVAPPPYGAIARVGRAGLDLFWAMANGGTATQGPDGYWTATVVPAQDLSNAWVLNQISNGHWNDGSPTAVKPLGDTVIRGAKNQNDMVNLGITWNTGNSFDGRRW